MADYFVSPNGNDANDGRSPATAWKTLDRVRLAGTTYAPLFGGDRVLLERGATFYGALDVPGGRAERAAKLHVSAYGYGPLPIVTAYKRINSDAWVNHAPNIWKVAINDPTKITGAISTVGANGANTGFLRVDGVIKGSKRVALGDLAADWEFYSDEAGEMLYVYSATNPGVRASEIMQAPRLTLIPPRTSLAISQIHFQGTGAHVHGDATRDFDFEGNMVSEIGGCRLGGTYGDTRYGNGIQFYTDPSGNPTKRCNVRRNIIRDVYDVGATMQGPDMTFATSGWEDVHITDNVFIRCSQAFELWNRYGSTWDEGPVPAGAGYRRCSYVRNIDIDSGRGWGAEDRPEFGPRCSLLTFGLEAPEMDMLIDNNMHVNPYRVIFNYFPLPTSYRWRRSKVFGPETTPIDYHGTETLGELSAYVARTGVALGTIAQCADRSESTKLQDVISILMENSVADASRAALYDEKLRSLGGEVRELRSAVEALREQPVSVSMSLAEIGTKIARDGTVAVGATGGQSGLIEAFQNKWRRLSLGGMADIAADANDAMQYMNSASIRRYTGTLTANRVASVSLTGCIPGAMFFISRTGGDTGGPWYLRVERAGGGTLADLMANQWCIIVASNDAPYTWRLAARGNLT